MNYYDDVLGDFCSTENMRPALQKVHLDDGFLYASNGHIGIIIPAALCKSSYEAVEGYPNIRGIIDNCAFSHTLELSLRELEEGLGQIPTIDEYDEQEIKCHTCAGDGELFCDECESEYRCRECGGDGFIIGPTSRVIGQTPDPQYIFKIGDSYFSAFLFSPLIKAAKINNSENILFMGSQHGLHLAQFDGVRIIVMPVSARHEKCVEIKLKEVA